MPFACKAKRNFPAEPFEPADAPVFIATGAGAGFAFVPDGPPTAGLQLDRSSWEPLGLGARVAPGWYVAWLD